MLHKALTSVQGLTAAGILFLQDDILWYSLVEVTKTGPDEMNARVTTDRDSPWFSGHFPGDPILPGIGLLIMVAECIASSSEETIVMAGLGRIKFRKIVRPGEQLDILATSGNKRDQYTFRITSGGQDVCSGIMRFTHQKKPQVNNSEVMSNEISQTITRIAAIIIEELKLEDVTPETFDADLDLVDEVGIDSMDLATIALVIRDKYGIRIDEDDYPKLTTVRIISEYIDNKLKSND